MRADLAQTICLALCCPALLAVGCGGDDSGSDGEGGGSDKEMYLERANAICADLEARTGELADRLLGDLQRPPGKGRLAAYERQVTALQRRALADLRALPAPAGDEERVAEIYDAMEAAIASLAKLPVSDPGEPDDESVARFQELAASYGLDDCAGR